MLKRSVLMALVSVVLSACGERGQHLDGVEDPEIERASVVADGDMPTVVVQGSRV